VTFAKAERRLGRTKRRLRLQVGRFALAALRYRKSVELDKILLERIFPFLFNRRNSPNGGDCHETVLLPVYTGRCDSGAGDRLVARVVGEDHHYHRFSHFDSDESLLQRLLLPKGKRHL